MDTRSLVQIQFYQGTIGPSRGENPLPYLWGPPYAPTVLSTVGASDHLIPGYSQIRLNRSLFTDSFDFFWKMRRFATAKVVHDFGRAGINLGRYSLR